MDLLPSPEGVRDNLWSSAIWAFLVLVGTAMLAAWAWASEVLSPPVLVVFGIYVCGSLIWIVNQIRNFVRKGREAALLRKIAELETELSRECEINSTRRKKQERLNPFILCGHKILDAYKSSKYTPLDNLGWKHRQWENDVKTCLHRFFSGSHVSRFLNTNAVVYMDRDSGVADDKQDEYTTLNSQIFQLQEFCEEGEEDPELKSQNNQK